LTGKDADHIQNLTTSTIAGYRYSEVDGNPEDPFVSTLEEENLSSLHVAWGRD